MFVTAYVAIECPARLSHRPRRRVNVRGARHRFRLGSDAFLDCLWCIIREAVKL